jgi:hypothetical protein
MRAIARAAAACRPTALMRLAPNEESRAEGFLASLAIGKTQRVSAPQDRACYALPPRGGCVIVVTTLLTRRS